MEVRYMGRKMGQVYPSKKQLQEIKEEIDKEFGKQMDEKISKMSKDPHIKDLYDDVVTAAGDFIKAYDNLNKFRQGMSKYRAAKRRWKAAKDAKASQKEIDALEKEKKLLHYQKGDNEWFFNNTDGKKGATLSESDAKEVLMAHSKFLKAINAFLGQEIVFLYVNENKEILRFSIDEFIDNFDKHVEIGISSSGDVTGKIKDIKANKKTIKGETVNKDWEDLYQTVLNRFDYSRERIKKASVGLILWYTGRWYGMMVPSKGPLGEAYTSYNTLDPEAKEIRGKNTEQRVSIFMTGSADIMDGENALVKKRGNTFIRNTINIMRTKKGALAADNEKGTMQGDFQSKDGNTQYAVKTVGASLQSYNEDYALAKSFFGEKGAVGIDNMFEKIKKDAIKAKKKARQQGGIVTDSELRKIFSDADLVIAADDLKIKIS